MRSFLSLLLIACAGLLFACGSQPTGFALIFDVPSAGKDPGQVPVVRAPRRVPFVDPGIEEAKQYLARLEALAKAPPPANWADVFKRLPKDDEDNIDWMAALKDKVITPSGVIEAGATDEGKTTDDDIELSTSGKPDRMVVFSHASHTQWLTCTNCHPAIFKRDAGTAKITMAAIDDGKYCGVCHDKVALAQPDSCKSCHRITPKPAPKPAPKAS